MVLEIVCIPMENNEVTALADIQKKAQGVGKKGRL